MKTTKLAQLRSKGLIACSVLSLFFIINSPTATANTALKMAKARDLPGKMVPGSCKRFAQALFSRLDRAGVAAYRVSYKWEVYDNRVKDRKGAHCIVVFKDQRGRYYAMDNMSRKPKWLKGSSPEQWVSFFARANEGTKVYRTLYSSAARPSSKYKAYASSNSTTKGNQS